MRCSLLTFDSGGLSRSLNRRSHVWNRWGTSTGGRRRSVARGDPGQRASSRWRLDRRRGGQSLSLSFFSFTDENYIRGGGASGSRRRSSCEPRRPDEVVYEHCILFPFFAFNHKKGMRGISPVLGGLDTKYRRCSLHYLAHHSVRVGALRGRIVGIASFKPVKSRVRTTKLNRVCNHFSPA